MLLPAAKKRKAGEEGEVVSSSTKQSDIADLALNGGDERDHLRSRPDQLARV